MKIPDTFIFKLIGSVKCPWLILQFKNKIAVWTKMLLKIDLCVKTSKTIELKNLQIGGTKSLKLHKSITTTDKELHNMILYYSSSCNMKYSNREKNIHWKSRIFIVFKIYLMVLEKLKDVEEADIFFSKFLNCWLP